MFLPATTEKCTAAVTAEPIHFEPVSWTSGGALITFEAMINAVGEGICREKTLERGIVRVLENAASVVAI